MANYTVAVKEVNDYLTPQVLQNKICGFYLGVHRFATLAATHLEKGLINIRYNMLVRQAKVYNWQDATHLPHLKY